YPGPTQPEPRPGEGPGSAPAPEGAGEARGQGRYTLLQMHAEGGIGQVWRARDHALGREVALKQLQPAGAVNPAAPVRFLGEARLTGRLHRPGVVPVYELAGAPRESQPFYTMRFIEGRTLTEAARAYHESRKAGRARPLDLRELLGAYLSACQTIAYAHSRGVIHRDIKGQNIVLGDFAELMVVDLRLAKSIRQPSVRPGSDGRAAGPVPPRAP